MTTEQRLEQTNEEIEHHYNEWRSKNVLRLMLEKEIYQEFLGNRSHSIVMIQGYDKPMSLEHVIIELPQYPGDNGGCYIRANFINKDGRESAHGFDIGFRRRHIIGNIVEGMELKEPKKKKRN